MNQEGTYMAKRELDQNTLGAIQKFSQDAKNLDKVATGRQDYLNGKMNYVTTQPRELRDAEIKVFKIYTDATCAEAYQMIARDQRIKDNLATFGLLFIFIIIFAVFCICMSGYHCCQKLRRKNNFFGQNVGEDDLVIEHNYSKPVYVSDTSSEKYFNVRDKNLLNI